MLGLAVIAAGCRLEHLAIARAHLVIGSRPMHLQKRRDPAVQRETLGGGPEDR